MKIIFLIIIILLNFIINEKLLILISLDVFRYEYLNLINNDKDNFPTIYNLINTGVLLKMTPVFPSETFPSHYSIVTGLHAGKQKIFFKKESSGVVGNTVKINLFY